MEPFLEQGTIQEPEPESEPYLKLRLGFGLSFERRVFLIPRDYLFRTGRGDYHFIFPNQIQQERVMEEWLNLGRPVIVPDDFLNDWR